jgi:hypothetical protein
MESCELGESSRTILEAIAEGRSYDQIRLLGLAETYHDIFRAAAETLDRSRVNASLLHTTRRPHRPCADGGTGWIANRRKEKQPTPTCSSRG